MMMPSKDKLNKRIMEYFTQGVNTDFTMINSIALAATHLIVICRKKLVPYVSNIKNETMGIGLGDMLSNKGSVCISFMLGKTRLLFINCHLEAYDGGLVRRNEQWLNINQEFVLKSDPNSMLCGLACGPKKSNKIAKIANSMDLEHFDSVIWLGDMNYRISSSQGKVVDMLMHNDMWEVMLSNC